MSQHIHLQGCDYERACKLAAQRGLSFSAYIRELVQADLQGRIVYAPAGTRAIAASVTETADGQMRIALHVGRDVTLSSYDRAA
jgi:hypothetical protein